MKFLIPTIGTRGDLQPYLALALGLQAAGHQPVVATHPAMRRLVEQYGVTFAPIGPDIDIGYETALIRGKSPNWVVGFLRVMKFSFNMLEQAHPDLLALCRQTDVVVVSHTAAGSVEADQLNLPTVSVTLMPQAIPADPQGQSWPQRVLMKIAGAGMGLVMTRPLDQIRKRAGVGPMGPTGITSPKLNLIPLSPRVIAPDPRWEPRHRMTGYWFAPAPGEWLPPAELQDFLQAGDPPVVISLGAMALSGEDAMEAAQITLAAVQQAGVRAVIQGWDEPMRRLALPATVFHAGSIPHDWLLQRSAAIVHHGGFGTTSAGLRAGIPGMAIPHIIDQFIWGAKLAELGVGPQPIGRSKLAVLNLAAALDQMICDEAMRARAAELGAAIRVEDGVCTAIQQIEAVL
ncbi:MAG: glycosyltransferase [Anaerolineae bacterium]|nr:glycosyltransferase [Anaerolineae bacterium]